MNHIRQPIAGLLLGLLVVASPALGQGSLPDYGQTLTETWCSGCHNTGSGDVAADAAPSFIQLANDPAITGDRLRNWLADPHPPMPDMSLTREEIDAIQAWFNTLRVVEGEVR